jgi:ubiquinone/menaquinone biosynthesis C-methylase UbiE
MTKPSDTGPNFASAEYAQQWQRGREMRGEGSEAATEMMLEIAQIRESDRVLEIAAGTGDLAVIAARRVGPTGYVLATDISTSMVNLTAETAREAGVTNIETLVMDADSLDLPEASFNAALCRSALMNFPNPIAQAKRGHSKFCLGK